MSDTKKQIDDLVERLRLDPKDLRLMKDAVNLVHRTNYQHFPSFLAQTLLDSFTVDSSVGNTLKTLTKLFGDDIAIEEIFILIAESFQAATGRPLTELKEVLDLE